MFCKSFLSRMLLSLLVLNSLIGTPDVFASEDLKHRDKIVGKIFEIKKEKNHEIEEKNNNKLTAKEKIINYLKSKGFELNIESSEEDEYFNTEIETHDPVEPLTWCEGHPLNVAKQLLKNKKQDIRSWCGIYCNNNIFEKNKELFKEFNTFKPSMKTKTIKEFDSFKPSMKTKTIKKFDSFKPSMKTKTIKEFDSFKPSMKTKTIGDIYESILIYLYTISRFQNEPCGSLYGFEHGFGLIKCLLDDFFEDGKIYGYNGKGKNDTRVVYRSACILAGTPGCLCIDMVYGYDRLKKFDLRFKIAS